MATGNTLKRIDEAGIRGDGILQLFNTLIDYLQSVEDSLAEYKTVVDELVDDHATFITAVDELIDDHATFKTAVDELNTLTDELRADHATAITETAEIVSDFEAHTHQGDGAQGSTYFTSVPKTDSATVTGGTDRTVGATAVSTITAAEATAGPATLSASKVSTLTAAKAKTAEDLSAKYLAKT